MKRRWVILLVGIFIVLALAAIILGRFTGNTQVSIFIFAFFVLVILCFWILAILHNKVFEFIEQTLWPRGIFLDDDRQQSVSVDESIRKTEFRITREQWKNLAPVCKKMKIGFRVQNYLFSGMFIVGAGAWWITSKYSISIPGYITNIYMILFVVVSFINMRHVKVIGLKGRCLAALLNHRCGSCLYELQGQIPESDGCVVCPECGGAWRLDRCPKCAKQLDSIDADSCPGCGWNRPVNDEAESEPVR